MEEEWRREKGKRRTGAEREGNRRGGKLEQGRRLAKAGPAQRLVSFNIKSSLRAPAKRTDR